MSGGEVADDEPQSAIDATGIGLIVAGVLLLIISALVVWYVIAKRRKRQAAGEPAKVESAAVSSVQSGKFNDDVRAYSSVSLVLPPVAVGEYTAPPSPTSGDTVTSAGSSSGGGSYAPMPMRP
jgi:hypothetical protein